MVDRRALDLRAVLTAQETEVACHQRLARFHQRGADLKRDFGLRFAARQLVLQPDQDATGARLRQRRNLELVAHHRQPVLVLGRQFALDLLLGGFHQADAARIHRLDRVAQVQTGLGSLVPLDPEAEEHGLTAHETEAGAQRRPALKLVQRGLDNGELAPGG